MASICRREGKYLLLILLFSFAYFHQGHLAETGNDRQLLLHSLFQFGRMDIDAYHTETVDKAYFQGHYYSSKAPGITFIALPAFALATVILDWCDVPLDSDAGWLFSSWFMTFFSIGLPVAFCGALTRHWLSGWVPRRSAFCVTLGLFLGTHVFPYSIMLFSHALVIGLLAFALWVITTSMPDERPVNSAALLNRDVGAGLGCGIVGASEFSAGIALLAIFTLYCMKDVRRATRFGCAALPPLLLVPLYGWICFNDPLVIGYKYEANFPQMQDGLFGLHFPPHMDVVIELLFGTARGLFFWSPIFVLAFFGLPELYRKSPTLFWLMCLAPVFQVVAIAGKDWDWLAGPSLGPRYLSPMLPFLFVPVALGFRLVPRFGIVLIVLSMLIMGTGTIIDANPAYGDAGLNPLTEIHLPKLEIAEYGPNLGALAGLPGHWQILVWLLVVGCLGVRGWKQTETDESPPVDATQVSAND